MAETADLIRYYCDEMERNNGYMVEMGRDPLVGYSSTNTSVMRPYGTWLVISPFNFPASLTGGPAGAALVAGNTVVMKPASDTPWVVRLIAECLRDAGLPDGAFNYVTGPGQHARAGVDHLCGCGWRHLHRLVRGGDGHLPRFLQLHLHSPHHPGAGRQEPGDRLTACRPGASHDGHPALSLWAAGAEMLGGFTRIRGSPGL